MHKITLDINHTNIIVILQFYNENPFVFPFLGSIYASKHRISILENPVMIYFILFLFLFQWSKHAMLH